MVHTKIVESSCVRATGGFGPEVGQAPRRSRWLGLVGRSRQCDRRPAPDEIERLLDYFDNNPTRLIPVGRIVRLAIASFLHRGGQDFYTPPAGAARTLNKRALGGTTERGGDRSSERSAPGSNRGTFWTSGENPGASASCGQGIGIRGPGK